MTEPQIAYFGGRPYEIVATVDIADLADDLERRGLEIVKTEQLLEYWRAGRWYPVVVVREKTE